MVVVLHTPNTSHKTNMKDLVTFGITKTESEIDTQSIMTESLVIGNTNGFKREDFPCLLKKSLYKACMTVLNISGWENSGVYPFDSAQIWSVRNIDIKKYAAAFAASTPLTFTTYVSVLLIDLNVNAMNDLTTSLATELACKHRRSEAT